MQKKSVAEMRINNSILIEQLTDSMRDAANTTIHDEKPPLVLKRKVNVGIWRGGC